MKWIQFITTLSSLLNSHSVPCFRIWVAWLFLHLSIINQGGMSPSRGGGGGGGGVAWSLIWAAPLVQPFSARGGGVETGFVLNDPPPLSPRERIYGSGDGKRTNMVEEMQPGHRKNTLLHTHRHTHWQQMHNQSCIYSHKQTRTGPWTRSGGGGATWGRGYYWSVLAGSHTLTADHTTRWQEGQFQTSASQEGAQRRVHDGFGDVQIEVNQRFCFFTSKKGRKAKWSREEETAGSEERGASHNRGHKCWQARLCVPPTLSLC